MSFGTDDLVVDEAEGFFEDRPDEVVEVIFSVRRKGSDEVLADDRVLLFGHAAPEGLQDDVCRTVVRRNVVAVARRVLD